MKKIILMIVAVIACVGSSHTLHPISMTVSDITLVDKKLHLKVKIFTDDLHSTLSTRCKSNIDISNNFIDAVTAKCIDSYITARLKFWENGAPLEFQFKRVYLKEDVTYAEYECERKQSQPVKSLKVNNTLLFEGFPEQKNIVNLKLNNSLKVLEFNNGQGEEVKEITY